MHYLVMVYENEKWTSLTPSAQTQCHRACAAWHDELVKSGHARGGACLQPPSTATTLRKQNGKLLLTDGPFAETKEFLGGFEIIECQNLDEALAIAKRLPSLDAGLTVEVRPMKSEEEIRRMMEA